MPPQLRRTTDDDTGALVDLVLLTSGPVFTPPRHTFCFGRRRAPLCGRCVPTTRATASSLAPPAAPDSLSPSATPIRASFLGVLPVQRARV